MEMDKELIDKLLGDYRKPEDLIGENGLLKQLTRAIVERALQAELTTHLGYEKHSPEGHNSGNSRNGVSAKQLKGDFGEVEIEVPRDRQASFEPKLVAKGQTRFAGFDDKILSLYARGMTTREIQGHLEEMYQVEVSPALISNVTDAVIEEVKAWQARPLDAVYPVVYLDALVVKMRTDGRVENRAVYVAIGITLHPSKHKSLAGDPGAGGDERGAGAVDLGQRRREVLAAGADRDAEPRAEGHLHRLRRWAEGFSAGH